MKSSEYDAIVIGSGFGGAVSACRLAEAGRKVLVLERGRKWSPDTYPRGIGDPWIWNQNRPHRFNGWADVRVFGDMTVIAGAGVGGGSLIYANVSVEAKPDAFRRGWPADITYDALRPDYGRVGHMLSVQEVPDNQLSARTRLMREGAEACGWGDRFRKLPLAVNFSPDYDASLPDARENGRSVPIVNIHGVPQGTCVHCGNCDIGCQVSAKNTLDLNYLAVAERNGAEIRPLHLVSKLEPRHPGWRVHYEVIDVKARSRTRGQVTAPLVLLGAGSIGSTELLLRCRDEHHTLPDLSPRLGHGWAFNGDFVTLGFYDKRNISPSHGVTISAAIDLLDYSGPDRQALFVEDGGLPNAARNIFDRLQKRRRPGKLRILFKDLSRLVDDGDPLENMMPWFGQAMEPGHGQLRLGRTVWPPWRRRTLRMRWPFASSQRVVESMIEAHRQLSEATGARDFYVPATWTRFHNIVTPHPLGGCNMGITPADGVVDSRGRVFNYDGLYVMDGAVVPRAIGLNPSRTIAALAERNIRQLLAR